MPLVKRGNIWYLRTKIKGKPYMLTTGFPVSTKKTKEAAERRAADLIVEIRSGELGWKSTVPTLKAWWLTYQKTYSSQKSAPERDDQVMAHALPFFGGDVSLDKVKKSDCMGYLNKRRGDVQANPGRKTPGTISEDTVQRERSFLQALWNQAIEDGHEITNPWKGIERKQYSVRDRLLTADEQTKLLAVLSIRFQRFLLFLLGTGVRLNEVRTIDPARDLNLTQRFVTVTGKFNKTRHVPIPAELLPLIKEQLQEDGELWKQNPQRLREVLGAAAKKAKIAHLGPHTMRHTFGWRYLTGGGDIYTLSKLLGHASVAVTERHYAHLLKTDVQDKADLVDMGIAASVKALVKSIEEPAESGSTEKKCDTLSEYFGV